jgi:hypothetical protein
MSYYDTVIYGTKSFKILACDDFDGFQHLSFIFHKNKITLFQKGFSENFDLKIKY